MFVDEKCLLGRIFSFKCSSVFVSKISIEDFNLHSKGIGNASFKFCE